MAKTPFLSKRAPYYADVPDEKWNNWRWQLSNRINTPEEFEEIIPLTEQERKALSAAHLFQVSGRASHTEPEGCSIVIKSLKQSHNHKHARTHRHPKRMQTATALEMKHSV